MTHLNNSNNNERINTIENEIKRLQEELEILVAIKEENNERQSIVKTYEYYMMLVLRNNGIRIFYPEVKEYYEAMVDQFINFDEKHPRTFNEQEIVDNYKFWLVWKNN